MAGRFSVVTVFKGIDKMTAPISKIQNKLSKMTRSISNGLKKVNRGFSKVSAGIKKTAMVGAVGLAILGGAMTDVIQTGAEFGRSIGSAAAKFPERIERGTDAFKALKEAARDVGRVTEFTSTQAAEGLNFFAKAGFSANFAMKALKDTVDFATASETDFATAADIASDALGAFGLNTADEGQKLKNFQRIMDVMSKTANSTNTSVIELFESVKKGGPVSDMAGQSLETFSATMGFLANSGIKAAEAGTAARNITLSLAGVGNKAAKTFKKLGITLADLKGDLRDPLDVMDDLRKSLTKVTGIQKVNILEGIFGKRPLASAAKLLDDTAGSVRKLRKELEAAGGSSKATAAFIRNDVKGSLDALGSAIESVKISIFELNEGPLKKTIDKVTLWIRANEEMISLKVGEFFLMIIENFEDIVKWAVRIGKAILVFYTLFAILKTFVVVMTAVNLVLALNPFVLITMGILAVIAAIVAMIVWWDELKQIFLDLPGWAQVAILLLLGPLLLLVVAVMLIKDNWQSLLEFFDGFWKGLIFMFEVGLAAIGVDLRETAEATRYLWEPVLDFFEGFWDGLVSGFDVAFEAISSLFTSAAEATVSVWEPVGDFFEGLWEGITSMFDAGLEKIKGVLSKVVSFAKKVDNLSGGFIFKSAEIAGFGDLLDSKTQDEEQASPQVISPQSRIAREIKENNTRNLVEMRIKDETGKAEITGGNDAPNVAMSLITSGGF